MQRRCQRHSRRWRRTVRCSASRRCQRRTSEPARHKRVTVHKAETLVDYICGGIDKSLICVYTHNNSVLGQVSLPYLGLYTTSKFALEGFTEALRYELRQFNIHVSLIEPGFVKTSLAGQRPAHLIDDYATARQAALQFANTGIERGMAPGVVAQGILSAARTPHPRLRYPVGREARLLSALKRLLPEATFERVRSRIFKIDKASTSRLQA